MVFLEPVSPPVLPEVPPGIITLGDMIRWYEMRIETYRNAFLAAEADKEAISRWISGREE